MHLTATSKKLGKPDREQLSAVLRAMSCLDREIRGQELGVAAARALEQQDSPELSVLADWLEEQGVVLESRELVQLLKVRAQRSGRQ